jgi:rubrerythrin
MMRREETRGELMGDRELTPPNLAGVQIGGEDLSRAELLFKGALAAGAVFGLGMVGPYVQSALAKSDGEELDALNLVLSFEYLSAGLYERGKTDLQPSGQSKKLIEMLADDERQHIEALTATIKELGGKPVAKGDYAYAFPGAYEFFRLARDIENAGIKAYNGAIPSMKSRQALDLTASIVQVEGRHAAAVSMQRSDEPTPEAFDPAHTEWQSRLSVVRFTGEY